MRKSNVDTSRIPKFNTADEAVSYFNRYGKMTFHGMEMANPPYRVYSYRRNNGLEYFIDVFEDGTVVVIQRGLNDNKNF